MIPNHVPNDWKPDERVAIPSRGSAVYFHVHLVIDTPKAIRAHAAREGSELLTTQMRDEAGFQVFVASRERDVGGEG